MLWRWNDDTEPDPLPATCFMWLVWALLFTALLLGTALFIQRWG